MISQIPISTIPILLLPLFSHILPVSSRPAPFSIGHPNSMPHHQKIKATTLGRRGDKDGEDEPHIHKIEFEIPESTRVLELNGDPPVRAPSHVYVEFSFDKDNDEEDKNKKNDYIESKEEEGWYKKGFIWNLYDPQGDFEGKSLDDGDVFFKMNCFVQSARQNLNAKPDLFKLNSTKPYIHDSGEGSKEMKDLIKEVSIICPKGDCVHKDGCQDLEVPRWDQEFINGWDWDS